MISEQGPGAVQWHIAILWNTPLDTHPPNMTCSGRAIPSKKDSGAVTEVLAGTGKIVCTGGGALTGCSSEG